jgi:hypothetical protein
MRDTTSNRHTPDIPERPSGGRRLVAATAAAVLGTSWLGLLSSHAGGHVLAAHEHTVLATVERAGWVVPFLVVAMLLRPLAAALASAGVLGTAETWHAHLAGHDHGGGAGFTADVLFYALVALPICVAVTVGLRALPSARPRRPRGLWTVAALTAVALPLAGVAPLVALTPARAAVGGVCASAVRTIRYDVVAMQIDLPLNGWGDHIRDGMIYALANADATPNAEDIRRNPGRATPLVLRAAVGDCVKVTFTNRISGRRVGMHVDGVLKDVADSDGAHVGNNPDSTVAPGATRTYTWFAQREGQFAINDYGSGTAFDLEPITGVADSTSHGLYGGLVVLPAGFSWHDPETGRNLLAPDGHGLGAPVYADAHGPAQADDFRDYALVFLDEPEGVCAPGGGTADPCPVPRFPTTGLPDASFGFNYRTEPLRNRLRAVLDHQAGKQVTLPNGTVILPEDHFCDGWTNDQTAAENAARIGPATRPHDRGLSSCLGEESHLQSWAFGDQGKLTESVDETDVLTLSGVSGGSFRLTLREPTLVGPLTADGSAVDTAAARFRDEVTTTTAIPYGASAAEVQQALMRLRVLPMTPGHVPAAGDIDVTGGPGSYTIAFGQHFAGRDVELGVDGSALTGTAIQASVSDTAPGARKGRIVVLSDALLPKAYRGDPVHMRLIHAGVKETHPFHQHTNRWRQESADPLSTRLDVQSIGPGQTFDLVYEGGAGEAITADPGNLAAGAKAMQDWVAAGRPDLAALAITKASNGDQVFHCHLYPHFAQGFWAALRVFDRQRPAQGSLWPAGVPRTYADATPLEPLEVLPDYDLETTAPDGTRVGLTPLPDAAHPGYPLIVKGEYLQRAYRAPGAVVADRYDDPTWRRPGDTVRDYDSPVTTDLERANMMTRRAGDGSLHAVPGAFFLDPCPQGAPVREYHPTAIEAALVFNKAGWKDPNGKMYVEAPPSAPGDPSTSLETADAIRKKINDGAVQPEPYNMRARLGECVNMRTTNATNLDQQTDLPIGRRIPIDVHDGRITDAGGVSGGTAFHAPTLMSELSTHVHLVRFDELATDGTSIGWNYVQAPMVGQTYNYKWFVDVALRTVYFHDHQNPNTHQQHGLWAAMNVEPVGSQWTDQRNGNALTPAYCTGLSLPAPPQGTTAGEAKPPCYGVGSVSDVKVPDPATPGGYLASFREFTVNYSDFVPMVDAAGKPINPPKEPDQYAADQGGMAINYRNEPFPTRNNSAKVGPQREPANIFSSVVHGDPSTPIFRAYQGDPVIVRFMGGAHEEGHTFTLAGHRWLHEPDDPASNLYDSQFVMIAEFFNFEVQGTQTVKRGNKTQAVRKAREQGSIGYGETLVLPGGAGAPGDYLYGSQSLNDLWMGMWGIFRVPAKRVPDLQPLPTNAPPSTGKAGEEWPALKPGGKLNAAPPDPGNPCPTKAPQRPYNISLVRQDIVYNAYGEHDPNGTAYVLDSDLDAKGKPKAGTHLKPLVIRANEGDCLNITLTNRLPATGTTVVAGDPVNPVELVAGSGTSSVTNNVNGTVQTVQPTWPAGARASLHASGLVRYAAAGGDGSVVGYNYDSTVKPGGSITYKYYVDSRGIGVANLSDFGNLRGTRHHGAWGALVVEPKGSTYLDPATLAPLRAGEQAVIRYTDAAGVVRSYREFVADVQDGLNLVDTAGRQVPDEVRPDLGGEVDPEDQGERGINYRSEPFRNRLAGGVDLADVLSSTVVDRRTSGPVGDPATPVFRAYPDDPVMVRILNSSDLPRVHTFGISGHSWRYEPNDTRTNVVNGQGGLTTGRAFNAGICAGSNTPLVWNDLTPICASDGIPGDYLYNDRTLFHMLSGGVWGLLRVHGTPQSDLAPLPGR